MRVTDLYGIAGPVPFVDLYVDRDNLLFLAPSAIRNATDPLGLHADGQLVDYFNEVLRCRVSPHPADHTKGRGLLQQLHEPNETRLGMSARGVAGHGFGDELGDRLWDELAHNPACRAAALTRLEDLRPFVDGVDPECRFRCRAPRPGISRPPRGVQPARRGTPPRPRANSSPAPSAPTGGGSAGHKWSRPPTPPSSASRYWTRPAACRSS